MKVGFARIAKEKNMKDKTPQNPLTIRIVEGNIILHAPFIYSDFCRGKGGFWDKSEPPVIEGARPGAWFYPATENHAALLFRDFRSIIHKERATARIDPAFFDLARAGAASLFKLKVKNGNIYLRSPFLPEIVEVCHAAGGVWISEWKCWQFPGTETAAGILHYQMTESLPDDWSNAQIDPAFHPLKDEGIKKLGLLPPSRDFPPLFEIRTKTPLYKHQESAFWEAYHLNNYMCAFDMGTGKSLVAVSLVVNTEAKHTLIITKKAAIDVWPLEFKKHAAAPVKVLTLGGNQSVAVKAAMLDNFIKANQGEQLAVVLNWDSFWRGAMAETIVKIKWDIAVYDESQEIQAPGSKASMFAARLEGRIKRKIALTGTPFYSNPLSIYGQYRALDKSKFGTRYNQFLEEFAVMSGEYRTIIGFKNMGKLNRIMFSMAKRVMKRDVLELPPVSQIVLKFELSKPARDAYKSLDNKLKIEGGQILAAVNAGLLRATSEQIEQIRDVYGDGPPPALTANPEDLSVNNNLVEQIRLQQITGGYLPVTFEEFTQYKRVDYGKADLLKDILDGLPQDEPVVVFAKFSEEIRIIKEVFEKLGRGCLELSGPRKELKEWQAGAAPGIAVQIEAGGAGVDTTRACYCVFYSTGDNITDFEQAMSRLDRIGQTRPVTIYHLHAADTMDEKVAARLERKKAINEAVYNLGSVDNVEISV